jgi:hypothetical protein
MAASFKYDSEHAGYVNGGEISWVIGRLTS